MNRQEAEILITKYTQGDATPQEQVLVERYFQQYLANSNALPEMSQLTKDNQEMWNHLAAHIGVRKSTTIHLWQKLAGIAAAVAVITLGVWLYNISNTPRHSGEGQNPGLATNNTIAPGKNTATLTLSTGRVISLDTSRASVVVTDSVKAMTMLTAATPRGGTYQVVLPDGTRVWLNADSKISFPSQFTGLERKILLEGEAYFEVYKDAAHPFIVQTDKQQVEVLGTHFNVNSYSDEPNVRTTLLEGSVRVSYTSSHPEPASGSKSSQFSKQENIILSPGEQAVLADQQLNIRKVNLTEVVAWKNGVFAYKNAPLDVVMRQLARWYDVDVVYANEQAKQQIFTGTVSRYDQVKELLNAIEYVGEVKFKIEGRKIIVN